MSTQTIKAEIINNVLVAMSLYIMEQQTLTILQNVMQQELVRVNMEEITCIIFLCHLSRFGIDMHRLQGMM